jgi:hypothetical protein
MFYCKQNSIEFHNNKIREEHFFKKKIKLNKSYSSTKRRTLFWKKKWGVKLQTCLFCKSLLYRQIKIMEEWRKTRSASYIISKVLVCEHENTWEKTSCKLLYVSSIQNKTKHVYSFLTKTKNYFETHFLLLIKLIKLKSSSKKSCSVCFRKEITPIR